MRRPKICRATSHGLLCFFLLAACITCGCRTAQFYGGAPLPVERTMALESGMSKSEVLDLLGPPDSVGLRLQGSVFIYRYRLGNEKGLRLSAFRVRFRYEATDQRTLRLVTFFDKQGELTDFAVY